MLSAFLSFFSRYSKRTLRMELSLRTISLTISVRAFVALIVGELCLSRVFFFRKSIEVHLKKKKTIYSEEITFSIFIVTL